MISKGLIAIGLIIFFVDLPATIKKIKEVRMK